MGNFILGAVFTFCSMKFCSISKKRPGKWITATQIVTMTVFLFKYTAKK